MHPQPLFEIFGQGVYAYGICMAVGIIACFGFLLFAMWYKNFNEEATDKVLLIGLFGTGFGIFAAMLFQSVYDVIANPSAGFKLGGMTFIGGLIGGVGSFLAVWNIYVYVIAPRTKIKLLKNNMNAGLTDALPFIPIGIAIAHAFGRFGCFWGGCCYGQPAEWGLPCSQYDNIPRIPTQLFEMSFLFLLAGVMALLYFKFKFNYNFGLYSIAYGIWRFVLEFFRDDYRGGIEGAALSPSQIQSIIMVILGVGYFFLQYYLLSKMMKHPELQPRIKTEKKAVALAADGSSVASGTTAETNNENVVNEVEQNNGNAESEKTTAQNNDKEEN